MDELPSVTRGLKQMARTGSALVLLNDVARCDGIGDPQCVACLRRIAMRDPRVSYWFITPTLRSASDPGGDVECMDRRT